MKKYSLYQIDSFTKEKFKGNPAGVVTNADGLNEMQMLQIARELNNSETAFLFSPDDDSCHAVIRYFSPTSEVPICGHATIAAMYAKALEEKLDSCILNVKTKIGILPFEIVKTLGDYKIIITQGKIELKNPFDEGLSKRLLGYLGITEDEVNKNCPIQIASTGHSKVMIGIKSKATLNTLTPNFFELAKLSAEINCNGYFVFTFDTNEPDILVLGRMFAPAIGINEDPVTGNANGPLGAYLVQNKLVNFSGDLFEFNGKQGVTINRTGVINVKVRIKNNKPTEVKIMGDAVVAFKTEIGV